MSDDAEDAGDGSEGGTYTLVYAVPEAVELDVGALGAHRLPAGGYAYTGSALGSGGFARVDRHRRVAAGEHGVRHWHVDRLGGHPAVDLASVARAGAGRDAECRVARRLAGRSESDVPVAGFGASDCGCDSHLARYDDVAAAEAAVADVYGSLRG